MVGVKVGNSQDYQLQGNFSIHWLLGINWQCLTAELWFLQITTHWTSMTNKHNLSVVWQGGRQADRLTLGMERNGELSTMFDPSVICLHVVRCPLQGGPCQFAAALLNSLPRLRNLSCSAPITYVPLAVALTVAMTISQ